MHAPEQYKHIHLYSTNPYTCTVSPHLKGIDFFKSHVITMLSKTTLFENLLYNSNPFQDTEHSGVMI